MNEINIFNEYKDIDFHKDHIIQLIDLSLEAEIYISVEMARINSKEFNVSLDNELSRLIIHGVLHLIGFNDDTEDSKKIMFLKQEEIISNFSGNVCSE